MNRPRIPHYSTCGNTRCRSSPKLRTASRSFALGYPLTTGAIRRTPRLKRPLVLYKILRLILYGHSPNKIEILYNCCPLYQSPHPVMRIAFPVAPAGGCGFFVCRSPLWGSEEQDSPSPQLNKMPVLRKETNLHRLGVRFANCRTPLVKISDVVFSIRRPPHPQFFFTQNNVTFCIIAFSAKIPRFPPRSDFLQI